MLEPQILKTLTAIAQTLLEVEISLVDAEVECIDALLGRLTLSLGKSILLTEMLHPPNCGVELWLRTLVRSKVFFEARTLEPGVAFVDRRELDRFLDPRTRVVHKSVSSQNAFLRGLLRLRRIFDQVVFLSMLAHQR